MSTTVKNVQWAEIYERLRKVMSEVPGDNPTYFGVPRGGQVIAGLTGNAVDSPYEANVIIDDIIDSGKTKELWREKHPDKRFVALYDKTREPNIPWLVFPWENVVEAPAEENIKRFLQAIGEDPNREGLQDTPKRFFKFYNEFLNPPEYNFTTFEGENYDEMIVSSDIPFYSFCEHHLAPFFGTASIGYVPGKANKIVGISKLPRTLVKFASRLQNQERITTQVAEELMEKLDAKGVAVVLKARHLCQEMRGVCKPGIQTKTSCLLGCFKEEQETRNEFFKLIEL